MKKKYQYYRNQYIIGIYECKENDDSLIALCDNEREFAEFAGISFNDARVKLFFFFRNKHNKMRYKGRMCEIYFIDKINLED